MVPCACKLITGIDDPRVVGRITHGLAEILFAALCATLCGFRCCDGYAQFARAKVDFLRRYLPYEDGMPFHDTCGRLLRLIKPERFEAVLADLARRVTAGSAGHVAIDGKTVRGSGDVARGVRALHLLHAFATDVGLCIGQVAVGGKSNEITALPELLKLLDLSVIEDHPKRGRDVTMDAMHTQRASAKLLHEARAHDVMALKGLVVTCVPKVPIWKACEFNALHRMWRSNAMIWLEIQLFVSTRGFWAAKNASCSKLDRQSFCRLVA